MTATMKDIFYHALLARASYSDMKDNTEISWKKLENLEGQSVMTPDANKA
ncbi:hypothetical protein MOXK02_24200 (plasmid) [Moraxella sp. K02]